jgi:hypothetical protein
MWWPASPRASCSRPISPAPGAGLKPQADPFDVFLRLQQGRASPYGAFWRIGDRALVSNSPELFLAFDGEDRRIEARPIKGTRARVGRSCRRTRPWPPSFGPAPRTGPKI